MSALLRRIERDGSGNRDIQAFAILGNVNPHQPVAMAAGEVAQPGAFGAQRDGKALGSVPGR